MMTILLWLVGIPVVMIAVGFVWLGLLGLMVEWLTKPWCK
jgi:hypothetical protein